MEQDQSELHPLYIRYRDVNKSDRISPKEVKRTNRAHSLTGKLLSIFLIVIFIYAIWQFTDRSAYWYLLGGIMLFYLLIKHALTLFYYPCKLELTKDYKVSVILTCFNENPSSVVAILENILSLDYPVHEILFLDDGSDETLAYQVAKSFAEEHEKLPSSPRFQIIRFNENRGKRYVLIDGFKRATGDYFLLLDSDIEILSDALTELLRPFEKKKTSSVVGNIGVLNRRKGFLATIQSVSYFSAFQLGRASQSVTGDVIICSGAFSLHKKDFVMQHLDDLEKSQLFGITVTSGDDRSITAFSRLEGGKIYYQSTAYCETLVPEKWKTFQKQRRRWQRSGYIGSLEAIRDMFPRKPLFMLWTFADVYLWLIALIITIVATIIAGNFYIDVYDKVLFFIFVIYIQNVFYLPYKPLRFLFSPIHSFVYGISLFITRIHAAVTIKNDGWGTRKNERGKDIMGVYNRLINKETKLAVVGLGYVGLPLAVAFSSKVDTIGFDVNIEKVETYKRGIDPTKEVGDAGVAACSVDFTTDETKLRKSNLIVVAVPTPIASDNTPDLTYVTQASKLVARNLSRGSVVVYESTVYPGVTEDICIPILEKESGLRFGVDFAVGYSPERINPGDLVHRLETIVKIVAGTNPEVTNEIAKIYELIIKAGVHKASSIKVAEAAKVVENAQRDVNIAFMNELAMVFDKMEIDTSEVLAAMNTKWNALGFSPGLVGGHCIGVDPYYFIYEAEKLGTHSLLILTGRRVNEKVSGFIADAAIKQLVLANKIVKQAKVAILGLTFKENCPDLRNSKVMDLIENLRGYGIEPTVVDPQASPEDATQEFGLKLTPFADVKNMDCVIFAVAHDEFSDMNMQQISEMFGDFPNNERVIIDVKSIFNKDMAEVLGYRYWRL